MEEAKIYSLFNRLHKAHLYYAKYNGDEAAKSKIYEKAEPILQELEKLAPLFDMGKAEMRCFCDLLIVFGGQFVREEWKLKN